jgi:hypothetical protein
MATRSLEGAARVGRRARYRVNVSLDTDGGWLTGTPRLPRHLVDGLTCDGALTPVWTTEGRPVNVGRARRVVPHRTRVLVLDRDRGCRFPGCGTSAFVEVHHLVHWRDGGPTDLANLLSLCPHHHDGHHRGEFSITGDPTSPDGLCFETRTGLLIGAPRRARAASATSDLPTLGGFARRRSVPAYGRLLVTGGVPSADGSGTGPRPRPRLGRRYPAPTGGRLHTRYVDFSPHGHQRLRP